MNLYQAKLQKQKTKNLAETLRAKKLKTHKVPVVIKQKEKVLFSADQSLNESPSYEESNADMIILEKTVFNLPKIETKQ